MKIILVPDDGEWVLVPDETRERIQQWADAYPESVFPPLSSGDWDAARRALASVGLSLDRVSAANMKHVATKINDMFAAPPFKVVELPKRNGVDFGWNACLDEIERRAGWRL